MSTVYSVPVLVDGSLGAWETGDPLVSTLGWSQAAVVKDKLYMVCGHNGSDKSEIHKATFVGGLNDYSDFYNTSPQPSHVGLFKLPDYSEVESQHPGISYYIKAL